MLSPSSIIVVPGSFLSLVTALRESVFQFFQRSRYGILEAHAGAASTWNLDGGEVADGWARGLCSAVRVKRASSTHYILPPRLLFLTCTDYSFISMPNATDFSLNPLACIRANMINFFDPTTNTTDATVIHAKGFQPR